MELKAATVQYAKTRPVFETYNDSKYSKKSMKYQSELTAKAKMLPNIQEKLSLVQKDFEIKSTSLNVNIAKINRRIS